MSPIVTKILLLGGILVLGFLLYPTAFDARADMYEFAGWAADSFGLIVGYAACIFGLSLLPISGGQMRRGLYWFVVGTFATELAFLVGPLLSHYHLFARDVIGTVHDLGMLGGMVAYLLAVYWLLTIVKLRTFSAKHLWFPVLAFLVSAALFYPAMFLARTQGDTFNHWISVVGFGIGVTMFVMILREYRHIGPGYRKAITMMCISTVFMTLSYPAGVFLQPHAHGSIHTGVFHHGFMAIAVGCFLATIFYLKRLEIYSSPSRYVDSRTTR